jgi:hypothetical protein
VTEALVSQWKASSGNRNWAFYYDGANARLLFNFISGSADVPSSAWTPTTGQWYHLVADRNGSTFRIYADGVMVAKVTATPNITGAAATFNVGCTKSSGDAVTSGFAGWIDDVRVTKGVSRYGSTSGDTSFTPPTTALPRS